MAYTIALYSAEYQRTADVFIKELGNDFNKSHYKRVVWSTSPIAVQGQSTPPEGIVGEIGAPDSGKDRTVSYQLYLPYVEGLDTYIYGTAQVANGLYYSAGQDSFSWPLSVSGVLKELPTGLYVDLSVDGLSSAFKLSSYIQVMWSFDEAVQGGINPPSQIIAGNDALQNYPEPTNPNSAYCAISAEIEESDIGRTVYCTVQTPGDGKFWRAGSCVIQ